MPRLLRRVARVGVAAGTATAVSNRVSKRQAGRWTEQNEDQAQQQYAAPVDQPEPAEDDADVQLDRLQRLGELHNSGVLTDDEFTAQKAKILG